MSATFAGCSFIEHEIPDSLLLEALEGLENWQETITERRKNQKETIRYTSDLPRHSQRKTSAFPIKTQDDTKTAFEYSTRDVKAAAEKQV